VRDTGIAVVERKDVEAALQARRELGPEYEADIVDSLAEKIERRLDERLRERRPEPRPHRHPGYDARLVLGSLGIGIGATAVATGNGAAWLAVVAWIAIVLVNAVYALRR
jgi:hypothetical protein